MMAERRKSMKRVVVASANPVKLGAVEAGLRRVFPKASFSVVGLTVESGVGHQPMSGEETLRGARQRARAVASSHPEADLWVGIEGGVEDEGGDLAAFAWVVILSPKGEGKARSGTFFLPPRVADLVRSGVELGDADDRVFGRTNSKQEEGAIGLLTKGAVDRRELYAHAVCLALAPFVCSELYVEGGGENPGGPQ
jgi:inosine/xanthosine triphosphatase